MKYGFCPLKPGNVSLIGGTYGGGQANEVSDATELPNEVDMNSLTFIMSTLNQFQCLARTSESNEIV